MTSKDKKMADPKSGENNEPFHVSRDESAQRSRNSSILPVSVFLLSHSLVSACDIASEESKDSATEDSKDSATEGPKTSAQENPKDPIIDAGGALPPKVSNFIGKAYEKYNELKWDIAEAADSYTVYFSTSPDVSEESNILSAAASPLKHETKTNDTLYYYRIAGFNKNGKGPLSDTISIQPLKSMGKPTGVVATPAYRAINLAWAPVNGAEKYIIYFAEDSTISTSSEIIETSATSWKHKNLVPGTTYAYAVAAIISGQQSDISLTVTAVPTATVPVPENVSVIPQDGKVIISWDPTQNAEIYRIYYSENPSVSSDAAFENSSLNSFEVSGLTNGQSYYFRIAAQIGEDLSPLSPEVSATPLAPGMAPANFYAEPDYRSNVISFNTVPDAASYRLYYSSTPSVADSSEYIDDVISGFRHTNLTPGATMYYRLAAINAAKTSPLSGEFSATPLSLPKAPTIDQSSAEIDQTSFSWSASYGATSYIVYFRASSGVMVENSTQIAASSLSLMHSIAGGNPVYYRIAAVCPEGVGPLSTEFSLTPVADCDIRTARGLTLTNVIQAGGVFVPLVRMYGRANSTMIAIQFATYDHSSSVKIHSVFLCKDDGTFIAQRRITAADLNGNALRPLVFDNIRTTGASSLRLVVQKTNNTIVQAELPVSFFNSFAGKAVEDLGGLSVPNGFSANMSTLQFTTAGSFNLQAIAQYPGNRKLKTVASTSQWVPQSGIKGTITDVMGNIITLTGSQLAEYHTFCTYFDTGTVQHRTMLKVG